MAEYTAIVEASNAFIELLRDSLVPEPIEKREQIALVSPFESGDVLLTVHAFHIDEDPQNSKSGFYQQGRTMQKRYPAVLQVYYLITAHSKAPAHLKSSDCQRIIGRVIQTVKDNGEIEEKYMTGSLKDAGTRLKLTMQKPSYEQMLKIWNNTSTPYLLSVVCQLTGVEIDSRISRHVGRVAEVSIGVEQTEQIK